MNASLNKKLGSVKWGEYKLGTLFDIDNTLSFNADKLVEGSDFDYVTRTSVNQGILKHTGFVNQENINPAGTWSLGLLQMDFFYRKKPWYAGQFIKKITPKFEVPEKTILFFTTLLNKQKQKLLSVLVRDVDKIFKEITISLPTKSDQIDFAFMECFIEELEAAHMTELTAYLTASGLDSYELSIEEREVFQKFEALDNDNWGEYRIGDLFYKVKTNKLPYQAKELPDSPADLCVLPCLTSSFQNQGLNYYAPKDGASILKNVISIPSNSDVYRAYFQSREFTVLSDAYAVRWKSSEKGITQNQYLFMVMCINKITDLPIYSHKNKLGGWNVVKDKYINLPLKDGEIDFTLMETFIAAIKKLTIKDVVKFSETKVDATKKVVSSE